MRKRHVVDARLAAPMTADANDFLWQWGSSADYDPAPDLEKIEAPLLLINAADNERNPPETGITETAMKRVKKATLALIPASEPTSGNGTTANRTLQTAASGLSGARTAKAHVHRS